MSMQNSVGASGPGLRGKFWAHRITAPDLGWIERQPWMDDALCAQTDPEAFFPEKGGSTRDAKKICTTCEVKAQCLDYALANDERFGIWGGLSERERHRLRRGLPVKVMRERVYVSGFRRWSADDDAQLRKLHGEHLIDAEIGLIMGREGSMIARKRRSLGLPANRRSKS